MKKFMTMLIFMLVASMGFSQTPVPAVTSNGYLTPGEYVYIWGTTADTLKNADTLTYVMRIKGDQTFGIKAQVYAKYKSGTAAYKVYTYNSFDGVNYTAKTVDSLTVTGITGSELYGTALSFAATMDVYKKFVLIQSGTAKTVPKLIFLTRKN
jgi:hypothetical protein